MYIIQPTDGHGSTKAVHQTELLDSKELVPTTENPAMNSDDDQNSESRAPVSSAHSNASSPSDYEDELELIDVARPLMTHTPQVAPDDVIESNTQDRGQPPDTADIEVGRENVVVITYIFTKFTQAIPRTRKQRPLPQF